MIELVQIPYSPFCLVQRRILEYAGVRFKTVNIPNHDRALVWKLTRQRYYQVPIVKDGKAVLFETDDGSQVIAKYLDAKLKLDLFPKEWEGVQELMWRFFENEIEGVGFRLNDVYYEENVPVAARLPFIRHKERKFGRGCLQQWREQQPELLKQLSHLLQPCEQMLQTRPFLLADRPLFVDFNLFGMLGNFLYSGHYELPAAHNRVRAWYDRLAQATLCRAE